MVTTFVQTSCQVEVSTSEPSNRQGNKWVAMGSNIEATKQL